MADAVIEDALEGPEGRRAAREGASRTMSDDTPGVVLETGTAGPTPEDALADAHKALEKKDKELDESEAARVAAERTASQARDTAARERAGRVQERAGAVDAAVAAAKADKTAAQSAIRAAREAGDLDAELAANDKLASANYRLNAGEDEAARIKAFTEGGGGQGGGNGGGGGQGSQITPATQRWIDAHPKFKSDKGYNAVAMRAHDQALEDGIAPDSRAYFRALDEAVAKLDGDGGNRREDDMGDQNRGGRRESSEGAPSSRGNGGHGGASRIVKTPLGSLNVTRRSDGKLAIQIPPALRATFEEGAKISKMDLGDYAYEQVKIAGELADGGNGGLITEDGQKWS